jgi:maleamate amidohydrolase
MTEFAVEWSKFLTGQDKALLDKTSWAKSGPFGLGHNPVVLVVDLYYAALGHPRRDLLSAVAEWPSACGERGWEAVDRTAGFLDAARESGVPIVYFHQTPPEYGRWNRKPAKRLKPTPGLKDPNAIVSEVEPGPGDIVLTKIGPSGFHETPLKTILRAGGHDTVLVCGEATSGCVRSTVVDACTSGYRVGVVGDCCFDRFEASHWVSLFDMNQKYADVITAAAATGYLRELEQGAA